MFIKKGIIYAETFMFLKHKNRPNLFALSFKGQKEDFVEESMTLPIQVFIENGKIFLENKKFVFSPENLSYSAVKEYLIKSRYTNDEQLAVILNKDLSTDGKLQFARMQAWRDFATEIAKIVDEEGYIASTALDIEKEKKLAEITAYDSSKKVNSFTINGIEVWLDKDTRAGLKLRFEAELSLGKTNTTLWHGGVQFNLKLSEAIQMLYAIEVYASACYDNTQKHYSIVRGLTDKESVITYDYTEGYPKIPRFEL